MNRFLAFCALYLALIVSAAAQTSPNLITGQKLTAAQWNQLFINKQDTLGYIPLNTAGGTINGRLVIIGPSSGASLSNFNIAPGVVPGTPANGDLWTTTSGIFAEINGVTYNLLTPGVACPTCAVTNATNTFTAEQITDLGSGTEPASDTGTGWAIFAADTVPARFEATAFGSSGVFSTRASGGTRASPTAVATATLLGSYNGHGYDGSTWTGNPGVAIHMYAEATWSSSSHPGEICSATTPTGAITGPVDALCTHQDGGVTLNGAADEGVGTFNLTGSLYNNGAAPTGTGGYVRATSPTLVTPALGTPSSVTLTNGTGLPISTGVAGLGTNVSAALAVATASVGSFATIIAKGTLALSTSAIASGACTSAQTASASGVLTTDDIDFSFNGDPTGITGFTAPNMLTIIPYPTANNVNVKVCNNTSNSITPGAVTLNYEVRR